MMTARFFLRVSLCALLIVASCGMHLKGSKSHQQSSGDGSAGGNFASYQGASTGGSAPVLYSPPRLVSAPVLVQDPNLPQLVGQTGPVVSSLDSAAPAVGYYVVHGSAGAVGPLQAGTFVPGSARSLQAGAVGPLQTGPVGSGQVGAGLPETQWAVPPRSLTEAAGDAQTVDASGLLPSPLLPQPEQSFQSGEAASVRKEAERGNYQQQTEEFGYPADRQGPGQGHSSVVVPQFGVGGFGGYLNPHFDYRFLYGLLPPGTHTTFSQHHEKGKDYSQAIHYLTEHASDDYGSVQQKKVF